MTVPLQVGVPLVMIGIFDDWCFCHLIIQPDTTRQHRRDWERNTCLNPNLYSKWHKNSTFVHLLG